MRRTTSQGSSANDRTVSEAIPRPRSELLWHHLGDPQALELWLDGNLFHYDQLAAGTSRVRGCTGLGSYSWRLAVIGDDARHERWCWGQEKPRWLVRERSYGRPFSRLPVVSSEKYKWRQFGEQGPQ